MKQRFLLFFLFLSMSPALFASGNDTVMITRKSYWGFYAGYSNFFVAHTTGSPTRNACAGTTGYAGDWSYSYLRFGPKIVTAFTFSRPILEKGYGGFDVGVQVHRYSGRIVRVLQATNDTVISVETVNAHTTATTPYFAANLGREFFSTEKIKCCCGFSLWFLFTRASFNQVNNERYNDALCGGDFNADVYYSCCTHVALRLRASAGYALGGMYYITTLSLMHQRDRTYRPHHEHYYIRTYEPEE